MSNISERIRRLRELEAKATSEPWIVDSHPTQSGDFEPTWWMDCLRTEEGEDFLWGEEHLGDYNPTNLELAAEMRNSLLPLLEYIDGLEKESRIRAKAVEVLNTGLQAASASIRALTKERDELREVVQAWQDHMDSDNCKECVSIRTCDKCWGVEKLARHLTAALKGGSAPPCKKCGGSGEIRWIEYSPAGHPSLPIVDLCPVCKGGSHE